MINKALVKRILKIALSFLPSKEKLGIILDRLDLRFWFFLAFIICTITYRFAPITSILIATPLIAGGAFIFCFVAPPILTSWLFAPKRSVLFLLLWWVPGLVLGILSIGYVEDFSASLVEHLKDMEYLKSVQ